VVAGVDGLEHLRGFLHQASGKGLVGLLAVPRTTVRRTEFSHDFP
ncbi:uncharacterized protein METZ01_LOCUS386926, partial [marine metagenome]